MFCCARFLETATYTIFLMVAWSYSTVALLAGPAIARGGIFSKLALEGSWNDVKSAKAYPPPSPLDIGMRTYLHGLMDCGKTETAISCRGPGPARKTKEVYQAPL